MSIKNVLSFDWAFLFKWMMATTVGWILGRFLLPNLAFLTVGIAIGILQWLVVRDQIRYSWKWMITTTLGWLVGSTLTLIFLPNGMNFLSGVMVGVGVGVAQWLHIRSEFHWAGWWIVINIVAWTTGMALLSGMITTGVMVGLITGFALELLARYPINPVHSKA